MCTKDFNGTKLEKSANPRKTQFSLRTTDKRNFIRVSHIVIACFWHWLIAADYTIDAITVTCRPLSMHLAAHCSCDAEKFTSTARMYAHFSTV